ncbi:MAG: MATE family efflux transporter [Clostridia bacterium]|nr:MATE family efflux transporter [Clostridia bacterium]
MFTNKDLRKLIVPIVIEQVLAMTIGLADTIMVSSCGEAAVSGVSLVDSINFLFITLFTALATGGSVVAAQYIGHGDREVANKTANQLFYVSVGLALVFGLICCFGRGLILNTVYKSVEADVMSNAMIYFLLTAASYPFLAAYNSGAALFRSMGDSKTSMYTSFLMNGLNVVGNAVLIFGAKMGVAGAAWATLGSRVIGAVFITVLLLNRNRALYYDRLYRIKFNWGLIRKILYIGIPNGIENSVFQLGKIIVASIVAVLGTSSITANAICGNLASFQITPGMAVGVAMVTVVGQCVGAQKYDEARMYIRKLMFVAYCLIWGATLLLFLFRNPVLSLYRLSPETEALTMQCFMVHGICAIAIWPPSFALPNALRAANDVKFTMITALLSMMLFRVVLTYILIHFFGVGVVGVWIAMCSDWLTRAIVFVTRIKGDRWTRKQII